MGAFRRFAVWVTARAVLSWLWSKAPSPTGVPWSVKAAADRILDAARQRADTEDFEPGWVDRCLMWGGLHPLRFAAALIFVSAVASLPALPAYRPEWVVIPFPDLPSDYTHAGFFGTVWAVQATLVALVYPIVLTFVPILLQRRAAARFSLVVYMQDSGVVPAGTSSLLLLAWMGLEYLASPYIDVRYFLFAAATNGLWFLANLWLTGQFLVKTIKYVRGEFGEAAYRRLAVHYALRRDLHVALCEDIFGRYALQHGKFSLYSGEPIVTHVGLRAGEGEVVHRFKHARQLTDVNLVAVNWVASRWLARALASQPKTVNTDERREQPSLQVLPDISATYTDSIDIVRISHGPKLTFAERAVFFHAFRFEPPNRPLLDGNTGELLEEPAAEVQSQLEQGNFAKAKTEFARLQDLHASFVRVASASTRDFEAGPELGKLRAGWSWNGRSLNDSWLDAYRSLMRAAISRLEADQTIWKSLVNLPSSLVTHGKVQDLATIREYLQQFVLLDHFLSSWWQRRIHQTRAALSDEGAWLPQPEREDYRDAVVAMVTALTNFGGSLWAPLRRSEDGQWSGRRKMASVLLYQLDVAATLLFSAVERGDAAAARWHCDLVVHWLSERNYEFERTSFGLYQADPAALQVDVLALSEEEVSARIPAESDGYGGTASPRTYLWHTMQRHWEAMRLICSALVIELGAAGGSPKLAATIATSLLSAKYFQQGLDDGDKSFTDLDDILLRYIDLCCIDVPTHSRIQGFVEQVQRSRFIDTPIAGWMYTGSRSASHPEALGGQIAAILLALDSRHPVQFPQSVERLKNVDDLDMLRRAGRLLESLARALESTQLRSTFEQAAALRATWLPARDCKLRPHHLRSGLLNLRGLVGTRIAELLAGLEVSIAEVDAFVLRVSQSMFARYGQSAPRRAVLVRAGTVCDALEEDGFSLRLEKEYFTRPPRHELPEADVKDLANKVVNRAELLGYWKLLKKHSVQSVPGSDELELLRGVVQACEAIVGLGGDPVILAPLGSRGSIVFSYHWGWGGRPSLPDDITLAPTRNDDGALGAHMVNGYPLLQIRTPSDEFFVIRRSWIDSLVFAGEQAAGVIAADVLPGEPQALSLKISWRAEFREAS